MTPAMQRREAQRDILRMGQPPLDAPDAEHEAYENARDEAASRRTEVMSHEHREYANRFIVSKEKLNVGVNASDKATLDDGTKALWKTRAGETSDLRSNVTAGTYYLREAAASNIADICGVRDMMPRVVAIEEDSPDRGGAVNDGSLQEWLPGTPLARHIDDHGFVKFERDAAERMRVFDYVIGNSDRHSNNVLVAERTDGRVLPVLIDHGLAFPTSPPDRFIQPVEAYPMFEEGKGRVPRQTKVLATTRAQIKAIDSRKLAHTLHKSGLEPDAVRQTLFRVAALKADPDLLAVTVGGDLQDDRHWDQAASKDHSTEPYVDGVEDIMRELD